MWIGISGLTVISRLPAINTTTNAKSSCSKHESSELLGQRFDGSTIKLSVKKWQAIVSNCEKFEVKEEDSLDNKHFIVKQAFQAVGKV
jgi:hypothetical protein